MVETSLALVTAKLLWTATTEKIERGFIVISIFLLHARNCDEPIISFSDPWLPSYKFRSL